MTRARTFQTPIPLFIIPLNTSIETPKHLGSVKLRLLRASKVSIPRCFAHLRLMTSRLHLTIAICTGRLKRLETWEIKQVKQMIKGDITIRHRSGECRSWSTATMTVTAETTFTWYCVSSRANSKLPNLSFLSGSHTPDASASNVHRHPATFCFVVVVFITPSTSQLPLKPAPRKV